MSALVEWPIVRLRNRLFPAVIEPNSPQKRETSTARAQLCCPDAAGRNDSER
jgi:hypothetical protein